MREFKFGDFVRVKYSVSGQEWFVGIFISYNNNIDMPFCALVDGACTPGWYAVCEHRSASEYYSGWGQSYSVRMGKIKSLGKPEPGKFNALSDPSYRRNFEKREHPEKPKFEKFKDGGTSTEQTQNNTPGFKRGDRVKVRDKLTGKLADAVFLSRTDHDSRSYYLVIVYGAAGPGVYTECFPEDHEEPEMRPATDRTFWDVKRLTELVVASYFIAWKAGYETGFPGSPEESRADTDWVNSDIRKELKEIKARLLP